MLSSEQLKIIAEDPKAFFEENRYIKSQAISKFQEVKALNVDADTRASMLQEARELLEFALDIEIFIFNADIKPTYREALHWHYVKGLRYKEISRALHYCEDTLWRNVERGLNALANSDLAQVHEQRAELSNKKCVKILLKGPNAFVKRMRYIKNLIFDKFKTIDILDDFVECTDECKRLLQEAHALTQLASDIEAIILDADIKPTYKEVLRLRFIDGLQLAEAADVLKYNSDYVLDLQRRGIKEICKSIQKR